MKLGANVLGLSVFSNISGQQVEKYLKNISKNLQRQRLTNNYKMQSQNS